MQIRPYFMFHGDQSVNQKSFVNLLRFLILFFDSLFIQGTSPGRIVTYLFGMLSEAACKIELAIVSVVTSRF